MVRITNGNAIRMCPTAALTRLGGWLSVLNKTARAMPTTNTGTAAGRRLPVSRAPR